MKLRDKIDSIDREINMLTESVWYILKKMEISPSEIMKARDDMRKEEEIKRLKVEATRLGVKVA